MSLALLLAVAVAPVLTLLHVIWAVDRHREPLRRVFAYLAMGALVVVLGGAIEGVALHLIGDPTGAPSEASLVALLLACIFAIGLVEEWAKLFGLRRLSTHDHEIDEAFDWIVYAVSISLGFALVENLSYVLRHGLSVGIARALLAVPGHALNGTLMGYHMARASLASGPAAARGRRWALWEPALWHGGYDFLAFAASSRSAADGQLGFTLAFGALVLTQWSRCVVLVRRVWREDLPVPPLFYPLSATRFLRRRHLGRKSSTPHN